MEFLDNLQKELENGATVLAKDWIGAITEANKPKTASPAPAPATISSSVMATVTENKTALYVVIGASIVGILFLLFRGK